MPGPLDQMSFVEWAHVSPIMTRPKGQSDGRCIILDLSYPKDRSVNSFIKKNTVLGQTRDHSLPTVDVLLKDIAQVGEGAYMFTMDVERAYKNFRSCPLDWPLLAFSWGGAHYLETSMPFGSRASSMHMQRVATAITSILQAQGYRAHMYLDVLVVVAADNPQTQRAYEAARALFAELGLPEAPDKIQPPAQDITWLGVRIDTRRMIISMPDTKVAATLECIKDVYNKRSGTVRTLQSLLGKILHMSKCVQPA